ncbi:MAG: hypothetical protein ABSE97_09285 [Verrucomicrobiota bacterium]|jgi:uncharacterized protein involved in outer membrane biogenesis
MKRIKRILWGAVIVLIILIIGSAIVADVFLDDIAKKGIETVGLEIAKVSVKLDGVHLSLLTGSAKVKGLVVGNPEGYKTPHAISAGSAAVGVNPLSVLSDKIVVRSVRIEALEITFEGGLRENNLSKIMDNVNATAKKGGPASTNATSQAKPARKYEVDDVLITGAKVHVNFTGLGGMTLPLPLIHLTDLGKGNEGLTATDLTRCVLDAITSATLKAVSSAVTDIGNNAGKLGKDTGKAVGKGVNKITKGIGNLFGK